MESKRIYKTGVAREKLILDKYDEIQSLMNSGYSIKKISKELKINKLLIHLFFSINKSVASFGHKNQAYFTENEMLKEKDYSFKKLSNDEKEIYNQREKAGLLGSYFTSNDGLHGGHQG